MRQVVRQLVPQGQRLRIAEAMQAIEGLGVGEKLSFSLQAMLTRIDLDHRPIVYGKWYTKIETI